MKTKEELSDLKEEVETMNKKLHELTDEELAQVVGGISHDKIRVTDVKGDFAVTTPVMATIDPALQVNTTFN